MFVRSNYAIYAPLKGVLIISVLFIVIWFRSDIVVGFRSAGRTFSSLFSSYLKYPDKIAFIQSLEQENLILKSRLQILDSFSGKAFKNLSGEIAAVYSSYPFNDKNELVISKGAAAGMRPNLVVLAEGGFLVGKIVGVVNYQSRVRTIFDPRWTTSVAIGSHRIRAVLKGGSPPRLELIPSKAPIVEGDVVISMSPDIPIGTPIGELGNVVKDGAEKDWSTVILNPFFIPKDLELVQILTDFP